MNIKTLLIVISLIIIIGLLIYLILINYNKQNKLIFEMSQNINPSTTWSSPSPGCVASSA